jgi:hypothetical protein
VDLLPIDATDIVLNAGSGGLGLGQSVNWGGLPAGASDFPTATQFNSAFAGSTVGTITGGTIAAPSPASTTGQAAATGQGGIGSDYAQTANGAASPLAGQTAATGQGTNANTPQTGSVGNYFIRGVIIILGFIFVAVGLSMFRATSAIAAPIVSKIPGARHLI